MPGGRAIAATGKRHDVADRSLAEAGQARIEWADSQMPVLGRIRARFERERPLAGLALGACLHVTTETANLVRTLMAGGAEIGLCAANPLSTQDDVAAALFEHYGAEVFAAQGEDAATYYAHIDAVCDGRPQITMDDGADLVSVLHGRRTDQLADIAGGTEETTTGVVRLRALEAVMDGYEVLPGVEAAREGDVIISVTGNRDAVGAEHFAAMKDGAIVCNAGHFDVEIDKTALERVTAVRREVRPNVVEHLTEDGRRINLLADGRVVNLAAAEGHPPAVMDVSFANQVLSVEHIVRHGESLEKRVHGVPEGIDREIARLKLESLRVRIDSLTDSQRSYLTSWRRGT